MFETICTLPLTADLFAQALHPTEPVLSIGLSSGHVHTLRLPDSLGPDPADDDDGGGGGNEHPRRSSTGSLTNGGGARGCGQIATQWRTRRHKVSCRALGFSADGATLYSGGGDAVVKAACAETGQVGSKIIVAHSKSNEPDPPVLVHAASPHTLLLATDSGALHLHDLRAPRGALAPSRPQATHFPNDDYVSSLTALRSAPAAAANGNGTATAAADARQWASTGGTTLAVTDLRKGVLSRSEAQDDELLSSVAVRGVPRRRRQRRKQPRGGFSSDATLVVGDGNGVLTLWHGEGDWEDQSERIVLGRGLSALSGSSAGGGGGESVECLANVPASVGVGAGAHGNNGRMVAAGLGDGTVAVVQVGGANRVVDALRHDEVETVVAIGFDVAGRMVSGGGPVVKIWQEEMGSGSEGGEDEEGESTEESDGEESDSDESEPEPVDDPPRKKRKKTAGASEGGNTLGTFSGLD